MRKLTAFTPARRNFTLTTVLSYSIICGALAADNSGISPVPTELPPGELGKVVALGKEIVEKTNTHSMSKAYVGNALTCSSCHLKAGTDPKAASFLKTATAYPAWSEREGRAITLEDRVLNCFMRSMNGIRPPNGSQVSVAVTAYITWLSTGEKISMNPKAPVGPLAIPSLTIPQTKGDVARGGELYSKRCAECHSDTGHGTDNGPPVWGENSYNSGAGLAVDKKLAAWLKVAMPLDDATLTEQESLDIASYVNSHPRPKFVLKEHLPAADKLGEYNSAK